MVTQFLNDADKLNQLPDTAWKPRFYYGSSSQDRNVLEDLKRNDLVFQIHDTLRAQLEELLITRRPTEKDKLTAKDRTTLVDEYLFNVSIEEYGTWVYFPWSGRLVHILPELEYREVRNSRNLYLITPEEQHRLGTARIGVVGLSVGRAVLDTMAREGIGGVFRLADFDHLELSNMNRLDAGVHELGVLKIVLAARQLFEMDPYLKIQIFPEGLRESNLDAFFEFAGRLDLLIEECDDLRMKVLAREQARKLGIPVLMSTSDRGLLDVERFDREPHRPVLHGLLDQVDAKRLSGLTTKDKLPHVLDILDPDRLSERMLASLVEIEETIVTWPQLASSVSMGGALVADTARRILLGQMNASGRFYVDLCDLISDQTAWAPTPKQRHEGQDSNPSPIVADEATTRKNKAFYLNEGATVQALVSFAALAPSGGNSQPWHFVYRKRQLDCYRVPERAETALDFRGWYSQLALGAAVENMFLAAPSLGLGMACKLFPEGPESTLVCSVELKRLSEEVALDPLFSQIKTRMTNRLRGQRSALSAENTEALLMAACEANAELRLLTSPSQLEAIGKVLGQVDRIVMLEPEFHSDLMGELRWSPEEAKRTRDGIDVRSLELSNVDRAALELVARPRVVAAINRLGGGGALGTITRKWIDSASAVGLLLIGEKTEDRYFQGGRAMQRVWLTATSRGLALQPITVITAIHARAKHAPATLSARALKIFNELLPKYLELFDHPEEMTDVFLFRLHQEGMPKLRALRRSVEEILSFEHE
jgi:molybdopterin/thiamine biosynthesis adenylyltransferase